jgi:hypothetical protein
MANMFEAADAVSPISGPPSALEYASAISIASTLPTEKTR